MLHKLSIKIFFIVIALFFGVVIFLTQYTLDNIIRKDLTTTIEKGLIFQVEKETAHLYKQFSDVGNSINLIAEEIETAKNIDTEHILKMTRGVVAENDLIFGSGFWLEPYVYNPNTKYYGPYLYKTNNEIKLTWEYSNEKYNYFSYTWYKAGLNTNKKVVWSEPFYDEISKVDMITCASPIKKGNNAVGIVSADIALVQSDNYVKKIRVGENGYAFVLTRQGYYLAHHDGQKNMYLKISDDTDQNVRLMGGKILNDTKTGLSKLKLNGTASYVIYSPIGDTGMKFVLVMPESDALGTLNKLSQYSLVLFMTLLVMVFFALIYLINEHILVPIKALTNTSKLFIKGDFSARVNIKDNNEFGILGNTFNEMGRNLQELVEKVRYRIEFEELTSKISHSFINIKYHEMDNYLEQGLGLIGKFSNSDRSYIFLFAKDRKSLSCVYEWCRAGVTSTRGILQEMELSNFAWMFHEFKQGGLWYVEDTELIPPEGAIEKSRLRAQSIKSLICVPMVFGGELVGYLGLDAVNQKKHWLEEDIIILKVLAEIFVSALERKESEELLLNSYKYDWLTGLYSRRYFEQEKARIEAEGTQSVAILLCDVDGLKLINDTLGHVTGDFILKEVASVLKVAATENMLIGRVGGDEFAFLIVNTDKQEVLTVRSKIRESLNKYNEQSNNIILSLSIGFAIRYNRLKKINDLLVEADNNMYREKIHHSLSARSYIIKTLMKALEERDFITQGHAIRLELLVEKLGQAMRLTENSLSELRLLAQFHDIGKVGIPDRILMKPDRLDEQEYLEMQRHSEIGYRIAQSSPDLAPIADWILMHHEWWNGKGYPLGKEKYEIPLESRILAIADAFDAMTNVRPYRNALSAEEALAEIKKFAGIQFDPKLTALFIEIIRGPSQS